MNAQTPKTKKPITPDKVANLLASVFSKFLDLERRDEFYESLRKWDRGENPFVNFTRICTNYLISGPEKPTAFIREVEGLQLKRFTINTLFTDLAEAVFEYDKNHVYTQVLGNPHEVVSVHILDILDSENRRNTLTYEAFIDLAGEYHILSPCNLFNGFRALNILDTNDALGSYFIGVDKPTIFKDGVIPSIPLMRRHKRAVAHSKLLECSRDLEPKEINISFNPEIAHISRPRVYTRAFGYIYNESKIIMLRRKPGPDPE